jgi:hypothetical protein
LVPDCEHDNSVPRVVTLRGDAAQIDTALRTSIRPQRIERVQKPRTGQGNGSRPATWAKSLRQSGNRELEINKPAGS